jgi:hypothetical protein
MMMMKKNNDADQLPHAHFFPSFHEILKKEEAMYYIYFYRERCIKQRIKGRDEVGLSTIKILNLQ